MNESPTSGESVGNEGGLISIVESRRGGCRGATWEIRCGEDVAERDVPVPFVLDVLPTSLDAWL